MAWAQISTTCGSSAVLASAGVDDTPLGLPVSTYTSRSAILVSTRTPDFHRHCTQKSRPGRYSDSVNDRAGTPRIVCQYLIQLRTCSGFLTGIAPKEPLPLRIRHHRREREGKRRNSFSTSSRSDIG